MEKESITVIEETAKQLIAVDSLLPTIYFAAISFSDLKTVLLENAEYRWLMILVFVIPIFIWLCSMYYAVQVFLPSRYYTDLNSPMRARNTFLMISDYKSNKLLRAHRFLVVGFFSLLINIILYLALVK